jgi:vacuolar-type H+-ATPase subunit D/Vma8
MNASVRVTTRTDNVAGVKLPVFVQVSSDCFHLSPGSLS